MTVIDDGSWFDRLREWFAQARTDDEEVEEEVEEAKAEGKETR